MSFARFVEKCQCKRKAYTVLYSVVVIVVAFIADELQPFTNMVLMYMHM